MSVGKHAVGRRPLGKLALLLALAMIVSAFAVGPLAGAEPMGKSDVCHWDADAGTFHMININDNAFEKHLAHGDGWPASEVPGMEGYEFAADSCDIVRSLVWSNLATVLVPSDGSHVSSVVTLTAGEHYLLLASGTYRFGNWGESGIADAHCSLRPPNVWYSFHDNDVPTWVNGEDLNTPHGLEVSLYVNGPPLSPIDWAAVDPDGNGCDPGNEYGAALTGTGAPVEFTIWDSAYGDNSGYVAVDIWGWQ